MMVFRKYCFSLVVVVFCLINCAITTDEQFNCIHYGNCTLGIDTNVTHEENSTSISLHHPLETTENHIDITEPQDLSVEPIKVKENQLIDITEKSNEIFDRHYTTEKNFETSSDNRMDLMTTEGRMDITTENRMDTTTSTEKKIDQTTTEPMSENQTTESLMDNNNTDMTDRSMETTEQMDTTTGNSDSTERIMRITVKPVESTEKPVETTENITDLSMDTTQKVDMTERMDTTQKIDMTEKYMDRTQRSMDLMDKTPGMTEEMTTPEMDTTVVPTAMNMLHEDLQFPVYHEDVTLTHHLQEETTSEPSSTTVPTPIFVTIQPVPDMAKGRAINFTLEEEQHTENGIVSSAQNQSVIPLKKKEYKDLSDVSMDDEDEDENMQMNPVMLTKTDEHNNHTMGICVKGGLTYSNGEKIEDGCDTVCTCMNGKMDCTDRCTGPYFRKGKKIDDPLCTAKAVEEDPCCAILVCAADTETEPLEMCSHQNKTYHRGEKFYDGCAQVCMCEAGGRLSCKPRCKPVNRTSERCVEIPDPNDNCCKMVLCDVTLDDHEHKDETIPKVKLLSAKYVNSTAILFKFDSKFDDKNQMPDIEVSTNNIDWISYRLLPGGYLQGLDTDIKYARLENTEDFITIQNGEFSIKNEVKKDEGGKGCVFNGKSYKLNEEFYDNCTSFCMCTEAGSKCLKIQCPTHFGLDVVDPTCLEWSTIPPDFVPKAPNCCPKEVKCKNNGSCIYEGEMYQNYQELPSNITGCDKRCYCEYGKVECQSACPPVPAGPPVTLPCPPHLAFIDFLPGDDCCKMWMCANQNENHQLGFGGFPSRYPNVPGYQQSPDEINVQQVEAVDGQTVRLIFTVSPLIVGLHGRVEVRYTNRQDDNTASWELQVFAPPNDLIATQQLEFDLIGLQPDNEYKIKITVILRDLHNTPTSRVYSVRTPAQQTFTTMPPMIPIEPNLSVTDVNSTWANVLWRKLTDFELQFVDGVQLRFKEITGKVYAATPLIHRAVTSYSLENLKPDTEYEVGIFFIPFTGQNTELHSENMIHFTTTSEIDPYAFNVSLEISLVKATTVDVAWSGVPYPEDKFVNIYRAIYQSDSGKGDSSTFKIAKRDSPKKTTVMDLKPGTRYRLWLEVYLTNGKIKTSNVQDFITKPRSAPALGASTQQGKLSLTEEIPDHSNDYYGPLVIVAILAAIAILSTLILLMILLRRHSQNKAPISTPSSRVSQAAYDNPTYKVEIQQETMGL